MNGRRGALWVIAVLLAISSPLIAEPSDVIILAKPKVFGSLSRAPVRFTHGHHFSPKGVSCLTCHHVYKDGKNVLDPATLTNDNPAILCETCHVKPASLQKAFHDLCITCHDTEKKQGRQTGPRACGECHASSR
jgi:cytochrome c2